MEKEQVSAAEVSRKRYDKLIAESPTLFDTMTNSKGQVIDMYEDPWEGDGERVWCVCEAEKWAQKSDFFETDDMMADHGEYEPIFIDGVLWHGDLGPVEG